MATTASTSRYRSGRTVLAPFSGQVIDPASRWSPWDPARYGKVVAIVSDEPTSIGYTRDPRPPLADRGPDRQSTSRRGQPVGLTGITGDAAGTIPHLHLELRAPFLLRYLVHGVVRRVDAFDPRPSLLAAEPRRSPEEAPGLRFGYVRPIGKNW